MGGATNICSDKTGTLTMNQMTVREAWLGDYTAEWLESGKSNHDFSPDAKFWTILRSGVALNATALRQRDEKTELMKVVGMPTEMALMDIVDVVEENPQSQGYYSTLRVKEDANIVIRFPYDSKLKFMTTAVRIPDEKVIRFYVKGAPELLIPKCQSIHAQSGKVLHISEDMRAEMVQTVASFAKKAYRTLLVGYYDVPENQYLEDPDASLASKRFHIPPEMGRSLSPTLIVQGIFGIEDPVRPEVPLAVATCQEAGITVRMLTGDHPDTAAKIAEQCGIKTEKGIVITGEAFRALSDD